ncbi:MAG: SPOR domain-containing protein [Paludibacteraceae bacterium]|nr:SPOR domain-containing protein [Paludibacteraceae bacterium]MBQ1851317.1 SPOR domain-containing protein [Paludibacteraceae bacterium]MBQ2065816.1 SPOR domain-containing protein [Paludibacteraceae bacterium]MBQ4033180.1 SPOR domain-containing protein [Paludibacteraceae bacterium]
MKQIFLIFSALFLTTAITIAQDRGTITINQSEQLDSLVYRNTASQPQSQQGVTTQGFRVQIYSSNRNQSAKTGAFKIEKEFTESFPDTHAYITYTAPFWKVRVGDFSTYYEALVFSNKVKDTFPERATEVFVVKEDNIKPIYFNAAHTEPQDL